jgi:hypothetical protein
VRFSPDLGAVDPPAGVAARHPAPLAFTLPCVAAAEGWACPVPAGTRHLLVAFGGAPALWRRQAVAAGATLALGTLPWSDPPSLEVAVTGAARGEQVVVRVIAAAADRHAEAGDEVELLEASLDASGQRHLRGLPMGRLRVVAAAHGPPPSTATRSLDPAAGTHPRLELSLASSARFEVVVDPPLGPDEEPWTVELGRLGDEDGPLTVVASGHASASGSWQGELLPGSYRLRLLDAAGAVWWREEIDPSARPLHFVELPLARVRGRLELAGRPAAAKLLFGSHPPAGEGIGPASSAPVRIEARAESDGRFSLWLPFPGRWAVAVSAVAAAEAGEEPAATSGPEGTATVSDRGAGTGAETVARAGSAADAAPGARWAELPPVTVSPSGTELVLEVPNGRFTAELVDEDGAPTRGSVRVVAVAGQGGEVLVRSDADGRVSADWLEEGEYRISGLHDDGRRSETLHLHLDEAVVEHHRLVLRRATTLKLAVSAAGAPVAGAMVALRELEAGGANQAESPGTTSAGGHFEAAVTGRRVAVVVAAPGHPAHLLELPVPGDERTVAIDLGQASGRLEIDLAALLERGGSERIQLRHGRVATDLLPKLGTPLATVDGEPPRIVLPTLAPGLYEVCWTVGTDWRCAPVQLVAGGFELVS